MNVSRSVKFILKNVNPINVPIEKITLSLSKMNIHLIRMQLLNDSKANIELKQSYEYGDITQVRYNEINKKKQKTNSYLLRRLLFLLVIKRYFL